MNFLSVFDHQHSGCFFTWSNKHDIGFIERKLDRFLINPTWLDKFPSSTL